MAKRTIKLTESALRRIITESVRRAIYEAEEGKDSSSEENVPDDIIQDTKEIEGMIEDVKEEMRRLRKGKKMDVKKFSELRAQLDKLMAKVGKNPVRHLAQGVGTDLTKGGTMSKRRGLRDMEVAKDAFREFTQNAAIGNNLKDLGAG